MLGGKPDFRLGKNFEPNVTGGEDELDTTVHAEVERANADGFDTANCLAGRCSMPVSIWAGGCKTIMLVMLDG